MKKLTERTPGHINVCTRHRNIILGHTLNLKTRQEKVSETLIVYCSKINSLKRQNLFPRIDTLQNCDNKLANSNKLNLIPIPFLSWMKCGWRLFSVFRDQDLFIIFISNFWIRAHRENSFSELDVTGEIFQQRDWLKNYLVGVAEAFSNSTSGVVCAQPTLYRFFSSIASPTWRLRRTESLRVDVCTAEKRAHFEVDL